MMEYLIDKMEKIYLVCSPHFKLASMDSLVKSAHDVEEKHTGEKAGKIF